MVMMDIFQCWEKAVALCKELAHVYESQLNDFQKLAVILRKQADLCEKILTENRCEFEYFRCGFYGRKFPAYFRNKMMVFRGHEYEKIVDFTERLMAEFPNAQLFTGFKQICVEDAKEMDGQFLQIIHVNPISTSEVGLGVGLNNFHDGVDGFQFTRPLSTVVDSTFQNLWSEKTLLKTKDPFPFVLCFSEVLEQRMELVSPVENACNIMEEKNAELKSLIARYYMGNLLPFFFEIFLFHIFFRF